MSKDYLKELERLTEYFEPVEDENNAKPSEALKYLDKIEGFMTYYELYNSYKKEFDNIKQSLLKAQEQEKVLEIIKELISKHCKIELIDGGTYYQIRIKVMGSDYTFGMSITQEEFDLLKRYFDENGSE